MNQITINEIEKEFLELLNQTNCTIFGIQYPQGAALKKCSPLRYQRELNEYIKAMCRVGELIQITGNGETYYVKK